MIKEAEISTSRYRAIVDSAYDGIISINHQHTIVFANRAAEDIFGYSSLTDKPLNLLIPGQFRDKHLHHVSDFVQSDTQRQPMQLRTAVTGRHKNGTDIPLEISIAKIHFDGQEEFIALIRDATEKNKIIDELNQKAIYDSLTSLHNRHYLTPLLEKEFTRAKRYQSPFSLLYLDVDHFKSLNDKNSHTLGDAALKHISRIITETVRSVDTPGRWGGEEFLILAPGLDLSEGSALAERLRSGIQNSTFCFEDSAHLLTVTIGVAALCDNDTDYTDLIERADKNMLTGKRQGRNVVIS